jgi:hypothetical protein
VLTFFSDLANLDALSLGNNPALGTGIVQHALKGRANLTELDLTNTGLTTLPEGVFSGECAGASERASREEGC